MSPQSPSTSPPPSILFLSLWSTSQSSVGFSPTRLSPKSWRFWSFLGPFSRPGHQPLTSFSDVHLLPHSYCCCLLPFKFSSCLWWTRHQPLLLVCPTSDTVPGYLSTTMPPKQLYTSILCSPLVDPHPGQYNWVHPLYVNSLLLYQFHTSVNPSLLHFML